MSYGIKRANKQAEYTPEQIQELRRCKSDPVYFIRNYVKIQNPVKGPVPFDLFDYQIEMLDAIINNKDSIFLFSRQLGKCVSEDTSIKIARRGINGGLIHEKITIGEFHKRNSPNNVSIPDYDGNLKFVESADVSDYYVETDVGFSKLKRSLKTIVYDRYHLELANGLSLDCADTHVVIDSEGNEVFIKDLKENHSMIATKFGASLVTSIKKTDIKEHMYDLELDDGRHLFFTNGILSHNTTVVSMYILWLATFSPSITAVIASKSMSHATEIMSRIKFAYEELPDWIKAGCKFYNRTAIEFDNGSSIKSEATTEKTGRGSSPSVVFLDEIAFISRRIQEELWASLTPSLSTGGKFIITSTPNGDDDLFANLWRGANSGSNSFFPLQVLWNRHPERGEEYYKDMLGKLGPVRTRQEIDCEFLSSDSLLIDAIKLNSRKSKAPVFTENDFDFYLSESEMKKEPSFIVGIDPSTGREGDFSVVEVFSFPKFEQVAEFKSNKLIIPFLYGKIKWILNKLTSIENDRKKRPEVFWSFERNSIGEAISVMHFNDEHQNEYAELINEDRNNFGMYTTNSKKVQAALKLKSFVEKLDGITINSNYTLFELKNYVAKGKGYEAKIGAHDDAISAILIVIRILDYLANFDENAFNKVYNYEYEEKEEEILPVPFAIV